MDQNKLAELNAMATGGTTGLAQYQASQSGANDARSAALNSAAGFGQGTSFVSSAPLQSALSATASKYSAPGADYMSAVAAQGPGLDAASAAAASNWQNEKSSELQSELATSRAKIQAQTQADQQDQQNKLALLRLKSQEAGEQGQYQLGKLGIDQQAEALNPKRVTGQALLNQQQSVDENQSQSGTALTGFGGDILHAVRGAVGNDLNKQSDQRSQLQGEIDQIAQRNSDLQQQGALKPSDTEYLNALQEHLGSFQDPQAIASKLNNLQRADQASQDRVSQIQQLSQMRGQQASLDALDLPKFQFQQAVAQGMDPTLAAGTYLSNESDSIYQKKQQQYNQSVQDDTLDARANDLEARQTRQQQTADANAAAEETGWQPKDLINTANKLNLSIPDIVSRVKSDDFKKVDQMAQLAGSVIDDADAKALGLTGDSVGQRFDGDLFKNWLQDQKGLDTASKMLAWDRYGRNFSLAPASEYPADPAYDPYAAG